MVKTLLDNTLNIAKNSNLDQKLSMYILLTQSEKTFKRNLIQNDTENKFTVFGKEKEEKDPEQVKAKIAEFKSNQDEFNCRINKWKEENKDLFVKSKVIPNISKYVSVDLNDKFATEKIDPRVSNYLFRTYASLSKDFLDSNRDDLTIATKTIISPAHASEYNAVREDIRKSVGLPTTAEINNMVKDTVIVRNKILKRIRKGQDLTEGVVLDDANCYAVQYMSALLKNINSAE